MISTACMLRLSHRDRVLPRLQGILASACGPRGKNLNTTALSRIRQATRGRPRHFRWGKHEAGLPFQFTSPSPRIFPHLHLCGLVSATRWCSLSSSSCITSCPWYRIFYDLPDGGTPGAEGASPPGVEWMLVRHLERHGHALVCRPRKTPRVSHLDRKCWHELLSSHQRHGQFAGFSSCLLASHLGRRQPPGSVDQGACPWFSSRMRTSITLSRLFPRRSWYHHVQS